MPLSRDLLDAHAAAWSGLVDHDFFRLAADRALPRAARDAYFLYERAFVDQAVVVFAHILAKAPDLAGRRHLVAVLRGLVHDQVDLFDRIVAECGPPAQGLAAGARPAAVQALCDGMTALARDGGYADGLAAMFVAERSYLEVSRRLATIGTGDRMLDDWFRLHTEPGFTDGVHWLARELDRLGAAGTTVARLSPPVTRAIALERDFHAAALGGGAGGAAG